MIKCYNLFKNDTIRDQDDEWWVKTTLWWWSMMIQQDEDDEWCLKGWRPHCGDDDDSTRYICVGENMKMAMI